MGARLRIFLTPSQDQTLLKLRTEDVPQKVKDRASVIRLNAQGWYVEKIAVHFNWTPQTVREVLHKWKKLGMKGFGNCQVEAENLDGVKKTSYF
jgi:DNA-binding NarL/FixJ family response regulator